MCRFPVGWTPDMMRGMAAVEGRRPGQASARRSRRVLRMRANRSAQYLPRPMTRSGGPSRSRRAAVHGGGGFGAKWLRRTAAAAALWLPGCALMPAELNLTPLWFHRLDEDGKLLEFDALWPIVHYERT